MAATVDQGWFNLLFAIAPFAVLLLILAAAFLAKRHERSAPVPIRQTLACARCGRRSQREHMVPQNHEGAVSWFCAPCAGAR